MEQTHFDVAVPCIKRTRTSPRCLIRSPSPWPRDRDGVRVTQPSSVEGFSCLHNGAVAGLPTVFAAHSNRGRRTQLSVRGHVATQLPPLSRRPRSDRCLPCFALQLWRSRVHSASCRQEAGCQRAGSEAAGRLRPPRGPHVRPGRRLRSSHVCLLAARRRGGAAVPVPPGQTAAVCAGGCPGGGGTGQRSACRAPAPPVSGAPQTAWRGWWPNHRPECNGCVQPGPTPPCSRSGRTWRWCQSRPQPATAARSWRQRCTRGWQGRAPATAPSSSTRRAPRAGPRARCTRMPAWRP